MTLPKEEIRRRARESQRQFRARIKSDPVLLRDYRRQYNQYRRKWAAEREREGFPQYISMQDRCDAIMALI